MTHRTSAGGSYRLDRVFPGVGRIAVASGASTKEEFKNRNTLLSRLHNRGRLDLLRAIKEQVYTVTEVYAADREDDLERLSGDGAILGRPLWKAAEDWIGRPLWGDPAAEWEKKRKEKKVAALGQTRLRYSVSFKALKSRAGLLEAATIENLNRVDWHALKVNWPNSDGDWFHLRAAVSHFLAAQLGRGNPKRGVHHAWRIEIMSNFPTAKAGERVPDIDVALFWRIVNETPEFVRPAYVAIAYLGLRVGEYLRLQDTDLLPATHQVRIPGTKTAGSAATLPVAEEMWPWISAAVPAPLRHGWLRKYWVRARGKVGANDVRLHDLRHLTAQALVNAGRSEASVQSTMRHASPAMTRRYAKQRDRGENAAALAGLMLQNGTAG